MLKLLGWSIRYSEGWQRGQHWWRWQTGCTGHADYMSCAGIAACTGGVNSTGEAFRPAALAMLVARAVMASSCGKLVMGAWVTMRKLWENYEKTMRKKQPRVTVFAPALTPRRFVPFVASFFMSPRNYQLSWASTSFHWGKRGVWLSVISVLFLHERPSSCTRACLHRAHLRALHACPSPCTGWYLLLEGQGYCGPWGRALNDKRLY